MVNMNVGYVRPNNSLLTLRNEVYGVYGQPARPAEFVTGYKSADNFTGHNADSNGIVHAVDIFTDDFGNIPQPAGRALAEKLRQIGKATGRFSYLIHDMGEIAQDPKIAGKFNNWVWQVYSGSSPHSDHIHVSTCDLYWGDPAPISAAVYDSTTPWGIAGLAPASTTPKPITPTVTKDWFDMATEAQLRAIVREEAGKSVWGFSGKAEGDKNAQTIWRRVVNAERSATAAKAQVAGLTTAIAQLATSKGLDATAITNAVKKALADGLVTVDVNVNGGK